MREVDIDELRELIDRGAQVVDVLPKEEFEDSHLPGAIHIPLRRIADEGPKRLRRDAPVVCYCFDDA